MSEVALINPNNYDPIWDLEKQYAAPLGSRVILVVKLNKACIVSGGVDTVLKHESRRAPSGSAMDAAVENSINDMNNMQITGTEEVGSNHSGGSGEPNPFSFLSDESVVSNASSSRSKSTGRANPFSKFGAKLKNHIDRGVTNIAVQAQKATGDSTKIRDLLTVGCYAQKKETGKFDVCLGMTERYEMPLIDTNDDPDGEGLTFSIPLIIPKHVIDADSSNSGSVLQLHLWMRSGAAIFAKNRALRKYVFVGTSTLHVAHLAQQIQPTFTRPFQLTLPLQSSVINSGKMTVTGLPDTKFPSLCGCGWSLSDPRTDTAYTKVPRKRMLFNAPLEQNYVFPFGDNRSLFTTERLTESTVVLPLAAAFMQLVSEASKVSADHASVLASKLQCLDRPESLNDPMFAMQNGHAQCQIQIVHFLRYGQEGENHGSNKTHVTINLQRPDSIFENLLASCDIPTHPFIQNMTYPSHPSITVPFYPRIIAADDQRLLPGQTNGAVASTKKFFLGKIRIQLYEENVGGAPDVFTPLGPTSYVGFTPRHLEAVVDIDPYLNMNKDSGVIYLNVVDLSSGVSAGSLAITLIANTLEGLVDQSKGISVGNSNDVVEGGLISLVGMDTLMEDDKSCYPFCDLTPVSHEKVTGNDGTKDLRRQKQIGTMGEFLTYDYMKRHVETKRKSESKGFSEKYASYISTLTSPMESDEEDLPPDEQKNPRPFRPSSSRMNELLSGIGFNIHIQSFCLSMLANDPSTGVVSNIPITLFQNVTHGAPSDHFRGFSAKGNETLKVFSGGLRRLEGSRATLADQVRDLQNQLIQAVSSYYTAQSQNRVIPGKSLRHIPSGDHKIASLRNACISATQSLHNLTFEIAARRSNCFSQALGIALSLFLAHVSDLAKLQKADWAGLWVKHGFLITFEGLLSAAGKELGMIEDAAVGIAMLRMVSVVFVTDQSQLFPAKSDRRFGVIDSPYLKWLRINPHGHGSGTKYTIEICVDDNYYAQRIPAALKNNTAVQFYPVLYQMGVDIRQWGANATNFGKKGNEFQEEMDEDEIGVPDNDELLALNYEAFRKMNAYAHEVFLCDNPQGKVTVTWEQAHKTQQIVQPIHPMLSSLYDYIRSSAGKMEHGILDEAGFASNRLGGGSAIFCKSGKDRTAMQVTFKQAQYINRYIQSQGNGFAECDIDGKNVFRDATTMRVYGTRLPICDKNVGQALYAFNSLQAKFMPDTLKPPPRALAGFLKGGRLLTGGGIES
jgi:hypothetical protein